MTASAKGIGSKSRSARTLGDALAVQLGDHHLDNLHEASSLDGFIGHGESLDPKADERYALDDAGHCTGEMTPKKRGTASSEFGTLRHLVRCSGMSEVGGRPGVDRTRSNRRD